MAKKPKRATPKKLKPRATKKPKQKPARRAPKKLRRTLAQRQGAVIGGAKRSRAAQKRVAKKLAAIKKKRRPPKKPPRRRRPRPPARRPGLYLQRRAMPAGTPLCVSLVLIITGAGRLGLLREANSVLSALDGHLRPVAARSSVSAYSSEWVWLKRPVDAYTVLPALAAVAPEMAVPTSSAFSFGVLLESGEFLSLASDSVTLVGAAQEAVVWREHNANTYLKHRPTSRRKPRARRGYSLEAA